MSNDFVYIPKHTGVVPSFKDGKLLAHIFPFSVSALTEKRISDSHFHDYVQLWYTVSGSYVHTINGVRQTHTAGSLALIGPYTVHSIDTSASDTGELSVISVSVYEDVFGKNILPFFPISYDTSSFDRLLLSPSAAFCGKERDRLDVLFSDIYTEYQRHFDLSIKSIYANIASVFELLVKHAGIRIDTHKLSRLFERTRIITNATQSISTTYSSNVPLSEYAKSAFMCDRSFSNKFIECTGQNYTAFCNKFKLSRAIYLLRHSAKSLDEIAELCGFYDGTHLSHVIKSVFGLSPTLLKHQMLDICKRQGEYAFRRMVDDYNWTGLLTEEYLRRNYLGMTGNVIE